MLWAILAVMVAFAAGFGFGFGFLIFHAVDDDDYVRDYDYDGVREETPRFYPPSSSSEKEAS
jgi:hypothetical protein